MATRSFLVVVFRSESHVFGDEPCSRRRFGVRKSCFWRRDLFSSSFLGQKVMFLATKPFLVTILSRETPFFGDEPRSRRRFGVRNSIFWRRAAFSSPFWGEKVMFLATRLNLVTILSRETPFFGDETFSRRHFEPRNFIFWRRDSFSSSF
ncbi:hypothetical protein [Caldifermentibacillus hisashii]|uniref:hypothetical protein n=1 Tax=Caldifermentibacillus hisashii TaxID=996558 RepID=UPI001C0F9ED0|nr:hypothetical protein [Caldifermentibacillus hisashii]MBU5341501.1 hypothetical protein [Caldifermentibacillus hisashii]